jgi:hypothetical protein
MQEPSESTQGFLSESTEVAEAPTTPAETTGAEEQKPLADETEPGPSGEETQEPEAPKEPAESPQFVIGGESVADEYGVVDHPKIKPFLDRWQTRTETRLQEQADARLKEAQDGWESSQTYQTLAGYYGRIMQAIQNGESEPTEKMLANLSAAVKPLEPSFIAGLRREGQLGERQTALKELTSTLGRREQDEFEDFHTTKRGLTWKDVLDRYVALREQGVKKPYTEKITSLEAQVEELKGRAREGVGPDLAPKGASGISTMDDADAAYAANKITHDQYKNYRKQFGVRDV